MKKKGNTLYLIIIALLLVIIVILATVIMSMHNGNRIVASEEVDISADSNNADTDMDSYDSKDDIKEVVDSADNNDLKNATSLDNTEAAANSIEAKEANEANEAKQNIGPITAEEFAGFKQTYDGSVDTNKMQDIKALMTKDYTGTWYDPLMGEAIRLTKDGAYVYIPYLEEYGDILYEWELVDRSSQGACPMLAIYINGKDSGPLAYYVAGYGGNYFYGRIQDYVFYKQ